MWRYVMVLVIATSTARAAGPGDEDLAAAEAAAKRGDFVATAAAFKRAYAHDPRPELICNVGVAYYKGKQLARAQLFLSRCLERGSALEAKFVDNVRTVLASVESNLRTADFTPVDIVVEPAGATVTIEAFGDDESFVGSRLVWLPFGIQKLVARHEGYADRVVEIDAASRTSLRLRVTLERAQPTIVETKPTPKLPPPPPPVTTHVVEHAEGTPPSKVPAIIATSASAAGIVLAIVGYTKAHDRADLAPFAVSSDVYDSDKHAVTAWNALTIGGTTVAVAGAALSAYLWSRAFRTHTVEVQAHGTGVAVSGRW